MRPEPASPLLRRLRPLLGCFVEVGIVTMRDGGNAEAAMEQAYAAIQRVQDGLGFHAPDSELTRLNQARGRAVPLSLLTLRVLRVARAMTLRSEGAFNCTVGGALVARGRLPDHGAGVCLLAGEAADMQLSAGHARLRRPVLITLDGIAKGFAVDLAISRLHRCGVVSGWINAGGDMRVFGDYTLAVRARGTASGRAWGVRNAALATSGVEVPDANRFPAMLMDGSGNAFAPAPISVLAASAWRADALTKVAACTQGAHRLQLLQRLGGRALDVPERHVA